MFMPSLGREHARSASPVVPVITPADRSNSPPIISSATATAMMPSVDATSVQRAAPPSVPNGRRDGEERRRPRSRRAARRARAAAAGARSEADRASRSSDRAGRPACGSMGSSSVAGSAHPALSACRPRRAPRPWPRSPCRRSRARSGPAGRRRRCCALVLYSVQQHDRQVALQVLLLVDREQDRAGLDRRRRRRRRGRTSRPWPFELAPRRRRRARRSRCPGSAPARRRSTCRPASFDLISVCVVEMSFVPATWRFSTVPPKPVLGARRSAG